MTPFMLAVQSLLDGEEAPVPATEPATPRSVAVATDEQVIIRSLAEQLVCEANAILREHGPVFSLVDDSIDGELAFTVGFSDRRARVRTAMSGREATVQLVIAGETDEVPRRLAGDEELRALLLSLLRPAPLPAHH
ncbi:hypothetical protein AB0F91_01520 [Amycolatopsis sp. NPDC023774]|uniref:hypothetical protein n=1 Tax=Amycolatopsis sp. NPDC023774 TaxID=3155015 RepID=UPI0033C8329B